MRYALVLALILLGSCAKKKGPQALFNGKDLEGWHMDVPLMDTVPNAPKPFIVRNGNLVSLGEPRGHLITDKSYKNYRFDVDYRFVEDPGNCGVLVHVSVPRRLYKMFPQSIEVQMQHGEAGDFWCIGENIEVPNMVERRGPKEKWGVDGDGNRRILNLKNAENPLGEWNHMRIECVGNEVKVWVNQSLVNYGFNTTTDHGQLALQAEGAEVAFKNIMLQSIQKLDE